MDPLEQLLASQGVRTGVGGIIDAIKSMYGEHTAVVPSRLDQAVLAAQGPRAPTPSELESANAMRNSVFGEQWAAQDPRNANAMSAIERMGQMQETADPANWLGAGITKMAKAARSGESMLERMAKPELKPEGELFGGGPAAPADVVEEAARKTQALQDFRMDVPEGSQFDVFRPQPGRYEPAFDKKKNKWYAKRILSDDEKALQKKMTAATKSLSAGEMAPVWDPKGLKYQPLRGETLQVEAHKKGMPEWVNRDLTPEAAANWDKLFSRAKPGSDEWFKMGQLHDDLVQMYGPEEATRWLDRFAAHIGATTSDATPPSNVRMAAMQFLRNEQGHPVPGAVPYPYGHARYETTHKPILEHLQQNEFIDPMTNPKGAHFAGNISGQTQDATLDRIVAENFPLRSAAGAPLQAPANMTYGYVRDFFREEAKKRGHLPMEWQAGGWAGHNPETLDQYGKPLIGHISDRINITSHVTGIPPQEVKQLWLEKKIPLLGVGAGSAATVPSLRDYFNDNGGGA